jgi:hypothetical protein
MGSDKLVGKARCFDGGGPIAIQAIPEFSISVPEALSDGGVEAQTPQDFYQGKLGFAP